MPKPSKPSGQYRFKRHDNIGAADAEDDGKYLSVCFEDNGDIDVLLDCNNPKRIILGRTGAGKTALLLELSKRSDFVIRVHPEDLSLHFITNSTILPYLSSIGVNLDPFFKLLWRHVFAVTIIQHRVDIVDESRQTSFVEQIKTYFANRQQKARKQQDATRLEKALDYLNRWGDRFFESVEVRTKEVVNRFDSEITKGLEGTFGAQVGSSVISFPARMSVNTGASHSESSSQSSETRDEIVQRAKSVVNEIQVQQLSGILDVLEEVLDDPRRPCYITIDNLDEPWAEDDIRLRLLKGLVDTVREFRKVHNAKIIICLRIDLLEQLFRLTRSEAGFQEDKYRSLLLPLRWTRPQLQDLLDKRVSQLIRDAFTNYEPTLSDVIPETLRFGRRTEIFTIDYILNRTWGRPRDAIEFLNACIMKSEGRPTITKDAILDAEGEYSRAMLRAIATEWHAHYPHLPDALKSLLTNRRCRFELSEISDEVVDTWSLNIACSDHANEGELGDLAMRFQSNELTASELRREIVAVFYKTGCVGLKASAFFETRWANSESYSVSSAEIDDSTVVSVHPGLWRVLGVKQV